MNVKPLKITGARVILASNSPRRRELLQLIVPEFDIAPPHDVDETYPPSMPAGEVAPYLSRIKACAYEGDMTGGGIMITADTVVIDDGTILGKPRDAADAVRMLRSLSGKTHRVVTGVTLSSEGRKDTFAETTEVDFAELGDDEIDDYVRRFCPMDKAGAYGIQEWIGCIGIKGIRGCFYNVMGLPLHALYTHLRLFSR